MHLVSNGKHNESIPSKRYFTIGEVSELCDVKSHVLRYWEQEFPSLSPAKRRGNRRYYQKKDQPTKYQRKIKNNYQLQISKNIKNNQ